jgi:hypothetical protein
MAGQIQIRNLNSERLYGEALEEMHTQLDCWYLEDKFAIKTKHNKTRLLHAQLMESILCPNSCELENWITLKIEGKLEPEDLRTENLKPLNSKFQTINIVNNYNTTPTWSSAEW